MLKFNDIEIYFAHDSEEEGFSVSSKDNSRGKAKGYKGITICRIKKGDEVLSEGASYCGLGDKFEKSHGRKISLSRALKPFDKEFRTSVWSAYLEKVRK